MGACYFCGQTVEMKEKIFRSSVCDSCGRELKICRNCRFYAPGYQWDCRESIQEPVKEKDRANFCDYFQFAGDGGSQDDERKRKARDSFDNLFS